jgi:hypothetical protein
MSLPDRFQTWTPSPQPAYTLPFESQWIPFAFYSYRFDVKDDGTLENRKTFAFVHSGAPDGKSNNIRNDSTQHIHRGRAGKVKAEEAAINAGIGDICVPMVGDQ